MKTIFKTSVFALVLVLAGAGCTATTDIATDEVTVDNSVTLSGITFDLPEDFSIESNDEAKAMLNVPHSEYEVMVPFSVNESDISLTDRGLVETTQGGVDVYFEACAPTLGCWYLVKDEVIYLATFEVAESTEVPPEDLNDIWSPSMEVESDQWLEIIKTAR